jgi:hypothetical protein
MPSTDNAQYAPAAWGSPEYDFELPSGDKCLLRRLDPLVLTEYDLVDKLDFVTSIVENKHVANANMSNVERIKRDRARREGKVPEEVDTPTVLSAMRGAENSRNFREVLNQVLVLGVVAPKLSMPPAPGEERVKGLVYVDGIPFTDKMAVFNELMSGVRTAGQFRGESEENVGDVAPKPNVRSTTKRPSGTRKRSAG